MNETFRNDEEDAPQTGRAMVACRPAPMIRAGDDRPLTDFLAQLIACDRRLPAYRTARKAEPTSAAAAYAGTVPASSSSLDRSV